MMTARSHSPARSRSALGWTLLFFAAGQAAAGWYVWRVNPKVRDWEYGAIITGLKAQLAQSPRRPLVLVLGSSRPAGVLRPSCLPPPPPGVAEPLVFNCSTLAAGPIRELQVFRRLLDDGVRPDWLFVEVWSPFLTQREANSEAKFIVEQDLERTDWATLAYCSEGDLTARRQWLENQLAPVCAYRGRLLAHLVPALLPPPGPPQQPWADPTRRHEEDGWLDPPPAPPLFPTGSWAASLWTATVHRLCDPFTVHPAADRALRELLRLARENGISTFLLLCPDHSCARGPAGMNTWAANVAYLEGLSAEYGAPIIDTRDWVADEEFTDFIHAARSAAAGYTRRFGQEVLHPLLAGAALPAPRLLRAPPTGPQSEPRY